MKKILLLLFFFPFCCQATFLYPSNIIITTPNVNYSQVGIQVIGTLSNPCTTIDSVRLSFVNNQLFFIINVGEASCINPNIVCNQVIVPYNHMFSICPPPSLNGTYSMKTIVNSYCPAQNSLMRDTSSIIDTVHIISSAATNSTVNVSSCNKYIIANDTIKTSGVYQYTFSCDSNVTYNVIIKQPTTSILNVSNCNSYFFNNQIITASGTYYDTLINANGCDSVVTLHLVINNVNNTVSVSGLTLSSNQVGATYQWLKCPAYSLILGANNQTYNATSNGDYAVSITNNNCIDTSNCYKITGVGINSISNMSDIFISPNPANELLNISSPLSYSNSVIKIINSIGQTIITEKHNNLNTSIDIAKLANGIYCIEILNNDKSFRTRFVKN